MSTQEILSRCSREYWKARAEKAERERDDLLNQASELGEGFTTAERERCALVCEREAQVNGWVRGDWLAAEIRKGEP